MSGLIRLNSALLMRNVVTHTLRSARLISSSQKNRDAATIDVGKKATAAAGAPAASATTSAATNKNWVSYGFDERDETNDRSAMHTSFFFTVTLCLIFGGFYWSYQPDTMMRDWAQREAYLALRRREAAGLEPISRDFVDPAQVTLPSEEELGNFEIVI